MLKKQMLFIVFITIIACNFVQVSAVQQEKIKIIYFYSSSCSKCHEIESYFNALMESYPNVSIEKHNIIDLNKKSLLSQFDKAYNVSDAAKGIIPKVFIGKKWFAGENMIKSNLEYEILNSNDFETITVSNVTSDFSEEKTTFLGYSIPGIIAAGLVNGLSPCSLSMLLFFLSILVMNKSGVLSNGLSFCLGKFLAFLLLGTLFYRLISSINTMWFNIFMKYTLFIIAAVLAFLSIKDFIAAKGEKYDQIKLQLPVFLRKFNHGVIKKLAAADKKVVLIGASFILGFIISFGEFLCTGQIYLATIVSIFQVNSSLSLQALLYLIVYNASLVIPLIILTFAVFKGKEIFDVSETLRQKLPAIKLFNAALFAAFGVYAFLYF